MVVFAREKIKREKKDVAFFGIPIAPETFCAQTLDKVIFYFVSFHLLFLLMVS